MQAARTLPHRRFPDRLKAFPNDNEPPIDLVHLARQTDGDAALEAELLDMFDCQSAKLAARVAETGLPRRARADVAHRLRGSALAVGATRVADAARALELALEADESVSGEPAAGLSELAGAVAEARAAIAALRG